jgi:chaperonin cofactor prefoldin
MTDFTQRAQELLQEKQQLIARIHQVDGALIEFEKLSKETVQEEPKPEPEIPN